MLCCNLVNKHENADEIKKQKRKRTTNLVTLISFKKLKKNIQNIIKEDISLLCG